jgi:hypothetical protein
MTPYGYPADRYHCLLDEQPYYLVPPRLFGADAAGPFIVNPLCWFSWHGPLPPEKAARVGPCESLCPSDWIVWVDDPATRSIWPYWIGQEYIHYLAEAVPGYPLTAGPRQHALWVLDRARVLVEPSYPERRRKEWLDTLWPCAEAFRRGYASVERLVPPFHLGALRRYYRNRTRAGAFLLGDGQVARRYAAHNEGVTRFFHHQLAPAVSDVARALVKPSYSYVVSYQSGSVLERHTDREQCEYSITMCIDASPEPEAQCPWPIQLDVAEGTLKLWQFLGDSLLYRGRYVPHAREQLPEGHTSTSLLLHYVDDGFSGSLD